MFGSSLHWNTLPHHRQRPSFPTALVGPTDPITVNRACFLSCSSVPRSDKQNGTFAPVSTIVSYLSRDERALAEVT